MLLASAFVLPLGSLVSRPSGGRSPTDVLLGLHGGAALPPAGEGPRDAVLPKLREVISSGGAIVGAGAGTGISAKFEEAGGADLIIVYNSGRFRMGGHGSLAGLLPFKDANAVMLEMGEEILPVLKHAPLLAGVCATDPFRQMDKLLAQVKAMGFSGVQNFPTVGLIDGNFRQNLEETGEQLRPLAFQASHPEGQPPCELQYACPSRLSFGRYVVRQGG